MDHQKSMSISFQFQSVLVLVWGLSTVMGRNLNLEASIVTSRGWCNSQDVYSFLNICGSIPEPYWGQRSCCGGALETIRACGDPQPCDSQYTEAIRKNCNGFCLPPVQGTDSAKNEEILTDAPLCRDSTVRTVLGICEVFPSWGQKACCGSALETVKACGYPRPCESKFAAHIEEKCEGLCGLGL